MNVYEAGMLLNLGSNASLSEAEAAYKKQARIFHPDKYVGESAEKQRKATDVMVRLNEAIAVIRQAGGVKSGANAGSSTSSSRYSFSLTPRRPNSNECGICGAQPAKPIKLVGVSSAFLWYSKAMFADSACSACAVHLFNDLQAQNLTKGWWGFPGIFIMLKSALANAFVISGQKRSPRPHHRDPSVITPLDFPLPPNSSVGSRPSTWLVTGVAVTILFLFFSVLSENNGQVPGFDGRSNNNSIPRTVSVGSCFVQLPDSSGNIARRSCSAPDAYWVVLSTTVNVGTSCPQQPDGSRPYIEISQNFYGCLVRK